MTIDLVGNAISYDGNGTNIQCMGNTITVTASSGSIFGAGLPNRILSEDGSVTTAPTQDFCGVLL